MRILLVEDDNRIAAFVAKGLRENSYAVDTAIDGDEATYMASINSYDIFILDVNLPKKDGFEVCVELRENGNMQPILMLTARDSIDDRISGLDIGADDYLTKPFVFRELLARLQWQTKVGKFAVGGDFGLRFKRGPDEMIYGFIVGKELNKSVEVMGEILGTGPRAKLGDSEFVYIFGSRIKLNNHANFIFSAGKSVRSNFDPRFIGYVACR